MAILAEAYDLIIAGGTILDPASGRREEADVGVVSGRIASIGPRLEREGATKVLNASGCYVTPGLTDFHIHAYWGVNSFGFKADPICVSNGVTSAVDAGSAGPVNFLGFKHFIAQQSRTQMLAFVSVAQHGIMRGPEELENLRFADPEGAARAVADHPDVAVGIKVRLHQSNVGDNGPEALRLAIEAGEASHSPVMVHIGDTRMSIEEIVETLRPGDIVTHCFTPLRPSIVDDDTGRLRPAVRRARERGVLFDVGHAGRHFDFAIVRRAMSDGFGPNIISTDLHTNPAVSPAVDLPTTMSKLLALGMSLEQVVAACTINPASAIGWEDRIGTLQVGRQADIAVLELAEGQTTLRDCVKAELTTDRRIVARWTIRQGDVLENQ